MDLHGPLKEYGLTDKEIEVYLLLLKLGESHLQEVSRRLDYPKTTVYNTLKYLVRKGLASTFNKDNLTYYVCAEPAKILQNAKRTCEVLSDILPQLEGMKNKIVKPSHVEMYEGPKGMASVYMDIWSNKKELWLFGNPINEGSAKFLHEKMRRARLEKKIPARVILPPASNPHYQTQEFRQLTKLRFLPALQEFPCMIHIYGGKVAITTTKKEHFGFIIENDQLAMAMRMIFEIFWEQAKPAWKEFKK